MNKLNQNQAGPGMGTFTLLIKDVGDLLDLANAGNTHQNVVLQVNASRPGSGDLVFVTGRSDDKNGPWKLNDAGTGFDRCTLQESLRDGEDIVKGATFAVESGDSGGRTFKVTSQSGKDVYQNYITTVGAASSVGLFSVAEVTPDVQGQIVRKLQIDEDADITGALDGANTAYVINSGVIGQAAIVLVTLGGDEVNHDQSGGVGYSYDPSTQTINFVVAPQPGAVVEVTVFGDPVDVFDVVSDGSDAAFAAYAGRYRTTSHYSETGAGTVTSNGASYSVRSRLFASLADAITFTGNPYIADGNLITGNRSVSDAGTSAVVGSSTAV